MKLVKVVGVSHAKAATERSNVRRFLAWAWTAADDQRANAAVMLAEAYLASGLPGELRRDLEICLTVLVEDASPLVRRVLAEAVADAHDAPRHIVLALADDQPEIACVVLARSPVLSEAELVEYAAMAEDSMHAALARRPGLPARVAARLAEIIRREAAMALIDNLQADLTPAIMRRLADRFIADGGVRKALLARPELPATVRYDLIEAAMNRLAARVVSFGFAPGRIEKMMGDARERDVIWTANLRQPAEVGDLVRHLRIKGGLTVGLLMRALISGARSFFEAAAVELSDLAPGQVAAFVRDPRGTGFAALCRRMGLPAHLSAPFGEALAIVQESGCKGAGRPLRPIASRAIAACQGLASPELGKLLALLRRLEKEAALQEARALAKRAAAPVATQYEKEATHLWRDLLGSKPRALPQETIGAPRLAIDTAA